MSVVILQIVLHFSALMFSCNLSISAFFRCGFSFVPSATFSELSYELHHGSGCLKIRLAPRSSANLCASAISNEGHFSATFSSTF